MNRNSRGSSPILLICSPQRKKFSNVTRVSCRVKPSFAAIKRNVGSNISRARFPSRVFILIGHGAAHYLKRYRVCDVLTRHLVPRPPRHHSTPSLIAASKTKQWRDDVHDENGPAFVPGNCLSFCYFAASKSQTSAGSLSTHAPPCSTRELHPPGGRNTRVPFCNFQPEAGLLRCTNSIFDDFSTTSFFLFRIFLLICEDISSLI